MYNAAKKEEMIVMRKPFARLTMILLVLILVLTACGGKAPGEEGANASAGNKGQEEQAEQQEQVLTVGLHFDVAALDPTWVATLNDRGVFVNMFETLLDYNAEDRTFSPRLATEWTQVDDTTLEFKLRENVKFSDGNPLTAQDVAYSLNRLSDPEFDSRLQSQAKFIKAVEAVDERTVRVTTAEPTANALSYIATFMIASEASLKQYDAKAAEAPAGTGPFIYEKWNKQQDLTLVKNENYWGEPAKIDKIIFRVIPNIATRLDELKTGSIDIATQVTPDLLPVLESNPEVSIKTSLGTTLFLGSNVFSGPLKDVRVRTAIAEAIDAQSIADNLYGGTAAVLNQPVTPKSAGHSDKVADYKYDPVHAKQLLTEAGYPDGFTLNFDGPQGYYLLDTDLTNAIAQQLNDNLGIKLNVQLTDYGTYWEKFLSGKIDGLYLAGITNPIQDAEFVLNLHLYSKGRGLYYNTPEADGLLDEAKSTLDQTLRQQKYDALMQKIHEDTPWPMTLSVDSAYGVSNRVVGWEPGDYSKMYFGGTSLQ